MFGIRRVITMIFKKVVTHSIAMISLSIEVVRKNTVFIEDDALKDTLKRR